MTERVDLGNTQMFATIDPSAITHVDGARLHIDGEGSSLELRFPDELLEDMPSVTHVAEVEGARVMEISINEDCFPVAHEIIFVERICEVAPSSGEMDLT